MKKNMYQLLTLPLSLIHFIVILCDSHLVWLLAIPFSQCLLFVMKDLSEVKRRILAHG